MKKMRTLFILAAFCLPVLNINAVEQGLTFGDKFELKTLKQRGGSESSNAPGVIQIGLGWGVTLGGAKIIYKDNIGSTTENGVGLNSNIGLRAQYGLTKLFSAGIFIRRENAAYVTTDAASNSSTFGTNGFGFGLEVKVYPVNKRKFALYLAPKFGFSTAKTNLYSSTDFPGKASGLNYGVAAGFNWWWAKFIGMSLDLGYSGSGLSGKFDDQLLFGGTTYKLNNTGFYFGLGLVSKFGG